MVALFSVIVIIFLSLLITKVATAALTNTGLSRYSAKFQARSAFTGVGFTTPESEQITRHPVRRKIISSLMLLGNAGIVTVMVSLMLTFIDQNERGLPWYYNLLILVGSIALLAVFASNKKIDAWLAIIIDKLLGRFTSLKFRDYGSLYKLPDDYHIVELQVRKGDWVEGRTLADCNVREEGITVLGIDRSDGTYLGAPNSETMVLSNDTLILYGREGAIKKLDVRRKGKKGDKEHQAAVMRYTSKTDTS